MVLPVQHDRSLAQAESQVELSVVLTQTVVRASTKNEVVLGTLLLSISRVVSVGVEVVGVLVHVGIAKSHVSRGNDHGALGDGVGVGDGESLLDLVGNHQDGRAVSQKLSDDGASVSHRLEFVQGHSSVSITLAGLDVLLANSVQHLGALGHDLEQVGDSTARGVLGCEEEGEDGLGDLEIGELANQGLGLVESLGGQTLLSSLTPFLGSNHVLDPGVHDTGNLSAGRHANLGLGGALGELVHDHGGSLLSVPGLGVGQDDGEVDKLESSSNQEVVVRDLLDGLLGDVVTDERTAGDIGHDVTEVRHEGDGLAAGFLGDLDILLELGVVDLLLAGQVAFQGTAGEETVEALAEVDVLLSVQKNPALLSEDLGSDIDDAGLDETGGVEDLARQISGGCDDNKPTKHDD